MREFNLALIGKWFWNMHVDSGGLWYKVLAARCGQIGGGCRRVGEMVMHGRNMCGRSVQDMGWVWEDGLTIICKGLLVMGLIRLFG